MTAALPANGTASSSGSPGPLQVEGQTETTTVPFPTITDPSQLEGYGQPSSTTWTNAATQPTAVDYATDLGIDDQLVPPNKRR